MKRKEKKCNTYEYKEHASGHSLLIHRNSTVADGQIFEIDDTSVIFGKG